MSNARTARCPLRLHQIFLRFSRVFRTGCSLAIAGAAAIALAAPAAASITGVCLDGSIFIVQRLEAVPCREHKLVDPSDVPPVKPQYLPRPYGWEKFNRRNDPNNPYNLIQSPPPIPAATTAPSREEPTAQEAEPSEIRVPQRSEFQTEASWRPPGELASV